MWKLLDNLLAICFVCCLLCAPWILGHIVVSYQCSTYERVTGKPTKTEAMTCYVNEGGQWMAWDEYKLRFATRAQAAQKGAP